VCVPSDEHQMRAAVKAAYEHTGPVYIRSGRPKAPLIYDATPADFAFGRARQVRDGDDLTIVANGLMVAAALVAAEQLVAEGIQARVLDMATVKPMDEDAIRRAAEETGAIVAAEEHLVHGGLGARVAQVVCRTQPVPMEFVGIEDTYAESGEPEAVMRKYGMTAERVAAAARRVVDRRGAGAGVGRQP
jgi:transketolase